MIGADGFGKGSKITVEEFHNEYEYFKKLLKLPVIGGGQSVFEVGCDSGVELYFFKKDGFKVGGLDYAETLLNVARSVIGAENFIECICAGAADLPTDIKYDAVFSNSVFPYFEDLDYVEKVLDRMLLKSKSSIGVFKLFKEETKEDYLAFRRKNDPNYDEHYKDLPRLFMKKEFFIEYAEKNNLEVKFDRYNLKNSWNEPFIFDCFLYKK